MNDQEQSDKATATRSRTELGKTRGNPRAKTSGTLKAEDLVKEGVSRQHADDWLKIRRAALTPTAWAAVKREAEAAGLTPADAVRIAAERVWRGFRAAWIQDRNANRPGRGLLPSDDWLEAVR